MTELKLQSSPQAASIMAVTAHPDDMESWCAGTLAQSIDAGAAVRLLLVTSGDKGSDDPTVEPGEVAKRREQEAERAARHLGIADVALLRHIDGEVTSSQALLGEIVFWIRTWRPAVVFTHDPEHPLPPYLAHRDHRTVGRVCLDAIYPFARDPLTFPEQLSDELGPHAVTQIWLIASAIAETFVDIREGFDRKVAARLAHESQTPDPCMLPGNWRARAAMIGVPARLEMAEAFTVIDV